MSKTRDIAFWVLKWLHAPVVPPVVASTEFLLLTADISRQKAVVAEMRRSSRSTADIARSKILVLER